MKNLLFILLIAAFAFLAIFFYWQLDTTKSELALQNQRILDRDTKIYKQDKLVDSLQKQLSGAPNASQSADTIELMPPPSAQFMDELGSLSEADLNRLQKKGLRNPEADLKNDLMKKQQQFIPVKGTVGGTMTIRDIRILNDRYALAYFEDGHNGGNLILKYAVEGGKISWKVLDSYSM
ncbi:hypothetical protein I5M27_04520 [Adhaeribacter sp. BT258]|uniref:DUF2939 domain-containing protein n=1 Tax=Adhaeribacter terrigena TaxID=2793070 RepID=A0ABS1BYJ2_9BACT|nr:hypothetical protein [Adhaeribacter terrigena]MBK0402235.1 hypothetical protein [Adhaeribacter terrigena]